MNAALFLSSLAWALLDFVWQGVLVGCIAAALLGLLGQARPQLRYALACAALLLCAALPVAGVLARLMEADAAPAALPAFSKVLNVMPGAAVPDAAGPAAGVSVEGWQEALRPRLPLLILCWAGGAGLLALRLLLGLAWVRRRSRPGAYRADADWQAALDRLAARLGLARRVVFGLVDDLASPVTAGWWRPVVLVPAALATGMAPQLLEALLAHELAHVRRHDYLVNLLQSAIEILLFYHPAVWWLSHRIRVERELVADDLAASMLGEPRRLALALSELDRFQLSTPHLAHAAHGGNLMSRIKRLVRPQSEPINWKLAVPVLGLALSAAVLAGSAQAGRQAEPAQPAQSVQQQVRQDAEAARVEARAAAEAARAAAREVRAGAAESRAAVRSAVASRPRGDGYALVSGDEQQLSISGDGADWQSLKQLRRNVDGEFLWFRDGGKSWIVQDRDMLARAHAAYAPLDRLGRQMNVYGKDMDAQGKVMDALGKDMSRAAAGMQPDQARMQALQGEMSALGQQMGDLGRQMARADEGERQRLDGEMKRLSAQMNNLGTQMRDASRPPGQLAAEQSMKAIGQRMDEAGKPMKALGQQMNVLGRQMEEEGRTADKTMRALIQEAMARGLAKPVPQG